MSSSTQHKMRVYHRYLGFFLAGIMAVYSISGIIMIFRETDFLKKEKQIEKQIKPNVSSENLGSELKIKNLKVEREEGNLLYFKQGTYNKETGVANYTAKSLPYVLDKMTKMHKATSKQPLFFLNIFFGVSLFFFVLSAFWMFLPKTTIFKKGMYFAFAGLILALVMIFI
ncbi:MAG TPA: hypothetical protein VJ552_11925 [Sediminibacterium sp.]|nr:hypothetical protein [Sediminibacterium sp.]